MTNFEKYKDDLMKIEGNFAIDKAQRRVVGCSVNALGKRIDCVDCIFNEGDCFESDKIKWLYSEYEKPILSDDELELINVLSKISGKEFKYIYKMRNQRVFIFCDKPFVDKYGVILDEGNYIDISECLELFPNIKFEDGLYDIKNKCFIKV